MSERGSDAVEVINADGGSSVLLVCEHASAHIPAQFDHLGLPDAHRTSHVAWDPGAMAVARRISSLLDAALVASRTSRLVYDCNRPPDASDAMPARSEVIDIPGNVGLSESERATRTAAYYAPFRAALTDQIQRSAAPIIVTIHSFTPIYHGAARTVEIGILHDSDTRLADAMLGCAAAHTRANVQRNQPYGPEHGVTHTLKEHALPGGYLNVMLEIRNDLIASETTQHEMAKMLAAWLQDATTIIHKAEATTCSD